ncbi:MAG: prephenate dehydratase [Candidatus Woesearchaeota archaeon]|jgi:prephenate dehydratase
MSKQSIACMGPEHSYGSQAAKLVGGETILCANYSQVVEQVSTEKGKYGLLPYYNQSTGFVQPHLDALLKSGLHIVGCHILPICHVAAGNTNAETVYSHPQGLAQCSKYLQEHCSSKTHTPTSSTSQAAKLAKEHNGLAICNMDAANAHDLSISKKDIGNLQSDQNKTYFLLFAKKPEHVQGSNVSTLIAIRPPKDYCGLLADVMTVISKQYHLSCRRILSRPEKTDSQLFYIEIETAQDDTFKNMVSDLHLLLECDAVKILGSFSIE